MVVENYRPDVKHRLGIDYETLTAVQPAPRLRQHLGLRPGRPLPRAPGLRPDRAGHGRADVDHRPARPGPGARRHPDRRPLRPGSTAALGILVALLEREESGEGQWVQTSLLQAQIAMLDFQAARWLMDERGRRSRPATTTRPRSRPASSRPRDGHINIAVSGQKIWERFCPLDRRARGSSTHPDYASAALRSKNRDALDAEIDAALASQTEPGLDRALQRGRRALRPDQRHRRGRSPTRRSSTSASRNGHVAEARRHHARRPAGPT